MAQQQRPQQQKEGLYKEMLKGNVKEYELKQIVGKGSFGEVYKATKNSDEFALKILDKKKIQNLKIYKYVESEVKIMKQINSENCLKLLDFFEDDQFYFMVLEYCKDGNLHQYIQEKKPDENECLKIFVQILNGFKQIHKLNYLHRDIKPENILIHDGIYKIADFGFATTSEIGKTYCGTGYYMSPEILQHKLHDHKTDLWSLAVLLFFMIFREVPFNCKVNRLQQIHDMCIPFFDLPKVLEQKKINIQYSEDLCELFKNIFVFNNLDRYNFSYLYYHCRIIKRYLSKTIIQQTTVLYNDLEKAKNARQITNALDDISQNQEQEQEQDLEKSIDYDDEDDDETLYMVQDEGHIKQYNNLLKSNNLTLYSQDLGDEVVNKFGPRKFLIQQCTINRNDQQSNENQNLNQVEQEIERIRTQSLKTQKDKKNQQDDNDENENTQQNDQKEDEFDEDAMEKNRQSVDAKSMNKNFKGQITCDSSMMIKINNLTGPSNSIMFGDINMEIELQNCIETYEYYIARYNFICDIIQLIPSLYLNQQDCNLCSFALSKQMIFFAQQLQNSLQENKNIYNLENFELFIKTPKKNKIIDQIQLDIDQYNKKLKMFYYGLDIEKVKKNKTISPLISETVTETDYNEHLKIPVRSILNPIYKFARDKGQKKYEEEIQQEQDLMYENGMGENDLNEIMQNEKQNKDQNTENKKNNKKQRKSIHNLHQEQPYHQRINHTPKDKMSSYSYLIPALGVLICMVINTIFDNSDIFQVFEVFYKEHDNLKQKQKFDFWKFFYWMERTQSKNLIEQMDQILYCAFGIKKSQENDTKTQQFKAREQTNYKKVKKQQEQ